MKLSVFWNAAAGTWIESRRSHYSAFGGLQKGGRVTGVASRVKSLTVWSVLTETKRDCRNTSVETADFKAGRRNWMLNVKSGLSLDSSGVFSSTLQPYILQFMHCKNISNQHIFVNYCVLKWWSCRGRKVILTFFSQRASTWMSTLISSWKLGDKLSVQPATVQSKHQGVTKC